MITQIEIIKLIDILKNNLQKAAEVYENNADALRKTSYQIQKITDMSTGMSTREQWDEIINENKRIIASNQLLIASSKYLISMQSLLLKTLKEESNALIHKETWIKEVESLINIGDLNEALGDFMNDRNYLEILLDHYETVENYEMCSVLKQKMNELPDQL